MIVAKKYLIFVNLIPCYKMHFNIVHKHCQNYDKEMLLWSDY